jgi:hypothetical protein
MKMTSPPMANDAEELVDMPAHGLVDPPEGGQRTEPGPARSERRLRARKGVRLAQTVQVGPRIPVGTQL